MSYSDERLDSQQLFDYCLLGQQLATNIATSCADTQHNHFFDSGGQQSDNWQTMSDVLTQQMKQLIGFEGKLNDGIQASIQCDQYIQQLMAQSDNQSLIDTNINEIFEEKLAQMSAQSEANVEEKEQYVKLMDVLSEFSVNTGNNGTDNGSDDDLQTLDTQENSIPIDPFSKREIEIAVINKTCGHVYDREQLRQVLEGRAATDGRHTVRCPTVGCNNKKVTMDDVQHHRRTQILIDKLKRAQN